MQRIFFDGDWTKVEQRVLERAILDAEALQGGDLAARLCDQLWFCYCKRLDGMAVYVAHRVGWMKVLHAYGVAALSLKILLSGLDPPDTWPDLLA